MKYRLPGIYLGNISMDLFMEYVRLNDLSDLGSFNEYFKVDNRTEHRSAHKVTFTISGTITISSHMISIKIKVFMTLFRYILQMF